MKVGWILVGAAVVVYLAAVGCAVWPSKSSTEIAAPGVDETGTVMAGPTNPAARYEGLPYRGMVLQVQRIDGPEVYQKAIDDIVALGADTVEIVVDSKQENGESQMIFVDVRMSPTLDKLTSLIKYAKGRGLRVVLMPIVLLERPEGNEWRGTNHPKSWEAWFESYRDMISHYASAAEGGHADVFVVGSELVSAERYKDEWLRTIAVVRQIYHGLLTYSANWDHYAKIPFWDHLDIISTNSYYKLGENKDVSVEEIVQRWKAIQRDLLPWVRSQHKPYMFTEVGWCSLENAADEPWDYTKDLVPIDLDLQKKLYMGFFNAWYGVPELGGCMIWQWTPNAGGPRDRGYTPAGKPAEKVLKEWFAKPRWTVKSDE